MHNTFTYIVLLNFNGRDDTIACLASLFALRGEAFRVVVCDNRSEDGSLAGIAAWCRGEASVDVPQHPRLAALVTHTATPPAFAEFTATDVHQSRARLHGERLVLIDNEANAGFAAGNNVGLRFALAQDDMTHVWLLNNDTLVEPDCLAAMQTRLREAGEGAVCGSMIHFFDRPEVIQAVGGNRFNRRNGVAGESEGRFLSEREPVDVAAIEGRLDYISGCSMLIPRELLETVGLLNEDYFLYYEEIDWFTRAGARVRCAVAPGARLYHREGGSIGSPGWQRSRPSHTADFHVFRSKMLYMRRFYPRRLLRCYGSSVLEIGKRLLRGQFSNARVVLSVLLGGGRAGRAPG